MLEVQLEFNLKLKYKIFCRAGPGVKNFVRERRRESCRERSMAYKRKHHFSKNMSLEGDAGTLALHCPLTLLL